jgi:phosphoribosyl 1,2-cyclic phosphodiesterase
MKICLLRSGSSGNCSVVFHKNTTIMLDAGGLSQTGFLAALAEVDTTPDAIDAAIISHLHSDHLNHAALALFKKHRVPLWVHCQNVEMVRAMMEKFNCFGVILRCFSDEPFTVKDMTFHPFLVSHDARATTSGFKFWGADAPNACVSFATDLGCFPDGLLDYFVNSAGIILEANHDTDLLWNNPGRPYIHKKRVASDTGHLSNAQAAKALAKILSLSYKHPRHIILSHLSKDHNSPEIALVQVGAELEKCGYSGVLTNAFREKKTALIEVDG